MEIKVKPENYVDPAASDEMETLKSAGLETQPMLPPATETESKWQQVGQQAGSQVAVFLNNLPEYVSNFYATYKLPIISIALIVAAIIALRVVLAVMGALTGILLLSPILETIGIGYTIWFVYRYLLQASTRQELAAEIQKLRAQILGNNSADTLS